MARPRMTETDDTLDDSMTERRRLIKSTQGVSDLSGDRAWVYIEEASDPSENYPVPIAVNSWNTALTRGIWINVPVEAKEALQNAMRTAYKTVRYEGGLPVKEPYESRSFPFQWEREFDAQLMKDNWFDPKQKQPKGN